MTSLPRFPIPALATLSLWLLVLTGASAAPLDLPESKVTEWKGFKHHAFQFDGRACRLVVPEQSAEGRPWIWRARFFGHRPEVDIALLKKGWHVAYIDVAGLFGSPTAVGHWDRFYDLLVGKNGFASKPALEGMSRGGLIVYNWTARNPDKVACIYADAPVCDFKSWPAGKGSGKGSPKTWQTCLAAYGFTEEQALAYTGNPIDNLAPVAKAGIPLLHVSGDNDLVVPITENTSIIERRYRALGGDIRVIVKSGIGHKHGLDDPSPIIDFVIQHAGRR